MTVRCSQTLLRQSYRSAAASRALGARILGGAAGSRRSFSDAKRDPNDDETTRLRPLSKNSKHARATAKVGRTRWKYGAVAGSPPRSRSYRTTSRSQQFPAFVLRRPLLPTYHGAALVTDAEVLNSLIKIKNEKINGGCIVVSIPKSVPKDDRNKIRFLNNVEDVRDIGTVCQVGMIKPDYFNMSGTTNYIVTLYGVSRVRLQGLARPPAPSVSGNKLDVTSFDHAADNDAVNFNALMVNTKQENVPMPDDEGFRQKGAKLQALFEQLCKFSFQYQKILHDSHLFSGLSRTTIITPKLALALADFAAACCQTNPYFLQDYFETSDLAVRMDKAIQIYSEELDRFKQDFQHIRAMHSNRFQGTIGADEEKKVQPSKTRHLEIYRERMEKLDPPDHVKTAFDEEMARLESTDPSSLEHTMGRNYVDWITQLPWGKFTEENYNVAKAKQVLDRDHYGLKDVKKRIMEFIATARLSGSVGGKIICLAGPPGVGKTSIGKSIAESLGREYARISVGGSSDVSEIKGHRRTYVGSMPGRVVQALKRCQSQNPLLLIDEIDKLGSMSSHGDPSAAMLEVLDPEQNMAFTDTFLDLPIDLSKVLFVCTANYVEMIPRPLKDRMEFIDLPGYVSNEKIAIAEQYLVPASKKSSGLEGVDVGMTPGAIESLVNFYSRELGVRGLKKMIEKVYRKVALSLVEKYEEPELAEVRAEVNEKEASATTAGAAGAATAAEKAPAKNAKDVKDTKDGKSTEKATKGKAADAANESKGDVKTAKTEAKPQAKTDSTSDPKSQPASGVMAQRMSEAMSKTLDPKPHEPEKAEVVPKRVWKKIDLPSDVKIEIDRSDLKGYLGSPIYTDSRLYKENPVGVVLGVAYTEIGGSALYVESVLQEPLRHNSTPGFKRTGQMGDVMNESSAIAYSFCRMFMSKFYPDNRFFERAVIHMHSPEGAIKKDGPSAGVTMITSLLSLALNRSIDSATAMTGEVTLTGKVLRIGGLREKTMAAKMAGAKALIFPQDNLADWEELPDYVREGIEPVPVQWYQEIFDRLFAGLDNAAVNKLWTAELARRGDGEESGVNDKAPHYDSYRPGVATAMAERA